MNANDCPVGDDCTKHVVPAHGTTARYKSRHHACRCPDCTKAVAIYLAAWKASKGHRPRQLQPCGTRASYLRGCRCEPCCEANRAYKRIGPVLQDRPRAVPRATAATRPKIPAGWAHLFERATSTPALTAPSPEASP